MDEVDRMRANEAVVRAHAAPLGEKVTWNNPESGHRGSVTPTRDGYSDSGSYCREFYETVNIGGRTEDAYGVACQQPDGSWRIVQQ
jgi:surface antigen